MVSLEMKLAVLPFLHHHAFTFNSLYVSNDNTLVAVISLLPVPLLCIVAQHFSFCVFTVPESILNRSPNWIPKHENGHFAVKSRCDSEAGPRMKQDHRFWIQPQVLLSEMI